MRLLRRDGSPLRPGRATVLSAAWGIGAGAGVALGAVLTAVSGAGAPGLSGLDVSSDLVLLPWLCGAAVFLVHLAGTLFVALMRGARAGESGAHGDQCDQSAEKDEVDREVGPEVPASHD